MRFTVHVLNDSLLDSHMFATLLSVSFYSAWPCMYPLRQETKGRDSASKQLMEVRGEWSPRWFWNLKAVKTSWPLGVVFDCLYCGTPGGTSDGKCPAICLCRSLNCNVAFLMTETVLYFAALTTYYLPHIQYQQILLCFQVFFLPTLLK